MEPRTAATNPPRLTAVIRVPCHVDGLRFGVLVVQPARCICVWRACVVGGRLAGQADGGSVGLEAEGRRDEGVEWAAWLRRGRTRETKRR